MFDGAVKNSFELAWIQHFPGYVFCKDRQLKYSLCNTLFARAAGRRHVEEMLGLQDEGQPWAEFASAYRDDDEKVLSGEVVQRFELFRDYSGELRWMHVIKQPIHGTRRNIEGVLGVSIPLSQPHLMLQQLSHGISMREASYKGCLVVERLPEYGLSVRESEVLFYLLRGKTAKQIARLLVCSPRTVESHMGNIKLKMGCASRSMLIEKAVASGLIGYIPKSLLSNE